MRHEADDDDGWQGSMTGWLLRPPKPTTGEGLREQACIAHPDRPPSASDVVLQAKREAHGTSITSVLCLYVRTYIHTCIARECGFGRQCKAREPRRRNKSCCCHHGPPQAYLLHGHANFTYRTVFSLAVGMTINHPCWLFILRRGTRPDMVMEASSLNLVVGPVQIACGWGVGEASLPAVSRGIIPTLSLSGRTKRTAD